MSSTYDGTVFNLLCFIQDTFFISECRTTDNRGSISGRSKAYSHRHIVQTASAAHPALYPIGTGDLFRVVKRPGREAEHSPVSSAEVKNA
jgi:hypothetical protein